MFNPIDPSLKLEQRNIFGYAVNWAPSVLRGTVPYTLLTLYVGNPEVFKRISDLSRVSLALDIGRYFVSLLTISKPFTYALPELTLASNLPFAWSTVRPLTLPNSSARYTPKLPSFW